MEKTKPEVHHRTLSPADAEKILAAIDREHANRVASGGTSSLDVDEVRLREGDILSRMQKGASKLSKDAPPRSEFYLAQARAGFVALGAAVKKHQSSTSGNRKFTDGARKAGRDLSRIMMDVREAYSERVTHSDAANDVKVDLLIGEDLGAEGLQALEAKAGTMLRGLHEHTEALDEAGVDSAPLEARVKPALESLETEMKETPATEKTRGEAAIQRDHTALRLDIVLSRYVSFLKQYGAAEAAEALESRVPRKHSRRSGDRGAGEEVIPTKGTDAKSDSPVTQPE